MKLWGGRFTKETNQLVHSFNESLSFDSRLFRQDIRGSIAHVTMLAKQGILTNTERDDRKTEFHPCGYGEWRTAA